MVTVTRGSLSTFLYFLAVDLGIYEDVFVVGVNPHDVGHGLAAGQQRSEGGKFWPGPVFLRFHRAWPRGYRAPGL